MGAICVASKSTGLKIIEKLQSRNVYPTEVVNSRDIREAPTGWCPRLPWIQPAIRSVESIEAG
jgi:hypothetical protein